MAALSYAVMLSGLVPSVAFARTLPFQGHIIEARSTPMTTLYLWDATPYVIDLVHSHTLGDPGVRNLEATGIQVLAQRAGSAKSKKVTLRVLYQKTGEVNPMYGTPTFAGVELVFTMNADRATLRKNAAAWAAQLAAGSVPSGLALRVTGRLPPP